MISRVLGALIRLFLLFLGAVVEVFIVVGGFLILLIWLILPLLLIAGLVAGFNLII